MRVRALLIATAYLTIACSAALDESARPRPAAVTPDRATSAAPVDVVIQGSGFLVSAAQPSSGGTPTLVTTQRAWLDETELQAVTWVDSETLRAIVPVGLAPGPHTLTVENALGERGSLEDAYTVLPAADPGASTTVAPVTPSPPLAPTGLKATGAKIRIDLQWNAVNGATGYDVLRGTRSGGPYTRIATTTSPSHSDTAVGSGTRYYYVVRATSAAGASPYSAQASATAR